MSFLLLYLLDSNAIASEGKKVGLLDADAWLKSNEQRPRNDQINKFLSFVIYF